MRNSILNLPILIILLLSVLSCTKNADPQPVLPIKTPISTPPPTNNPPPPYQNIYGDDYNSYSPSIPFRLYYYSGATIDTIQIGLDTTVNGIHYANFRNRLNYSDKKYFWIDGIDFHSGSFNNPSSPDKIYLKDAPAGTTWNNYYPNLYPGKNYRYTMTNDSVGYKKVVMGNTYSNVIKVKQEIYIDTGTGYILSETDYYYYSKGVGCIEFILPSGTTYLSKWIELFF